MTDPVSVLVVDDHFLFAQTFADAIDELPDYRVVGIAVTGPQALAKVRELRPRVALLDYHLPGYDADVLLPRLRESNPNLIVLVVTADTSAATETQAFAAGANGFITKDKALDDVSELLDHLAPRATTPLRSAPWSSNSIFTAAEPPATLASAAVAEPEPPPNQPAPEASSAIDRPPSDAAFDAPLTRLALSARASLPPVEDALGQEVRAPDGRPRVTLRMTGVTSFAQVVRIERFVERTELVDAVWLRDIDTDVASLSVTMREGRTPDELSAALLAGSQTLRVAAVQPGLLDLQVEGMLVNG